MQKKSNAKTPIKTTPKQPAPKNTHDASQQKALIQRLIVTLKAIRKKKQREESKTRNEFRHNIHAKHPNYIFEADTKKDTWRAIGITHEPETFKKKNAPLKKNPKNTDERQAYMRNGTITGSHKDFGRKTIKNMEFSAEDIPNVKAKIRNDKKKRKKKK